jgi:hypothetical protein
MMLVSRMGKVRTVFIYEVIGSDERQRRETVTKTENLSWAQCLPPLKLAAWEAEIGMVTVQGQLKQKLSEIPFQQ